MRKLTLYLDGEEFSDKDTALREALRFIFQGYREGENYVNGERAYYKFRVEPVEEEV
jgi:hypothetical protein